jgi:hypothetical protein
VVTEPISFTGRLSLEDFLDIHRYHSRIVIRTSIRLLMAVVSLLIAALIIFAGTHTRFVPLSFVVLAPLRGDGEFLRFARGRRVLQEVLNAECIGDHPREGRRQIQRREISFHPFVFHPVLFRRLRFENNGGTVA